jgi:hypothetical protein
MATVLLAPTGPAAANDTATATVTLHASVASLIVVDAPDLSSDCEMVWANKNKEQGDHYCVMTKPLTLRVRSNEPWSGTVTLADCQSNRPPLMVKSSTLRAGDTRARTHSEAAGQKPLKPGTLISETHHPAGEQTYSWYLVLRLNSNSLPADFCAMLSYTATQESHASATLGTIDIRFTPVPD